MSPKRWNRASLGSVQRFFFTDPVVSQCSIVDRALSGRLVVNEFQQLCEQVVDSPRPTVRVAGGLATATDVVLPFSLVFKVDYIFNSVRDFSVPKDGTAYSGNVATYIPQLARVTCPTAGF